VFVFIVANKIDDEENRQVTREEGLALAREQNVPENRFIETSAKSGVNVKVLFKNLASDLPGTVIPGSAGTS